MSLPNTLLQLAGVPLPLPAVEGSALVIIDAQLEYVNGALPLPRAGQALETLSRLLDRARKVGVPVVHVVHHGKPGGVVFDPGSRSVAIAPEVAPIASEQVFIKHLPNAFSGTELGSFLRERKVTGPVFAGFMTHMCVNSTVRAAMELGFLSAVVRDACATRPLPDGQGGVIDAEVIQRVHLAALADRFARIADAAELWR
jgi:nicotinamidase-related amidase